MKSLAASLFVSAAVLASGCSPSDSEHGASGAGASEQEQQEMVEQAVRRSYAREGFDVVEIRMQRSADGSAFAGPATVRNPETGYEMGVDCRYSRTVAGEPSLSCTRAAPQAGGG